MKHTYWGRLAVLALALALVSCAPAATATPLPTLAPEPGGSADAGFVQASAQVVPARQTELSFVISGPLLEMSVEKGDQVQAGQVLASVRSPELEYGLQQAQAAVQKAEYDYQYWKLPRRVGLEVVERGPVAEKELEGARRSLETAQARLTQTSLVSPVGATVVAVEAEPGQYVRVGQVVIRLAQLDRLVVETTDLSELDVAALEVGQPAAVYVEALDAEFPGAVTAIAPVSGTLGGDVVFQVTVELAEQPAGLLWGMSADVAIETE